VTRRLPGPPVHVVRGRSLVTRRLFVSPPASMRSPGSGRRNPMANAIMVHPINTHSKPI